MKDFFAPPVLADHLSATATEKILRAHDEAKSDVILMKNFLAGDEEAFREIMARHRPRIFKMALSLLHSEADAEEITQDTFIRAYRGMATFRGDCSLATWLYRIGINLGRNRYWHLHRRRRYVTLSLDYAVGEGQVPLGDLLAGESADPAQESARAEFSQLVAECLEQLEFPHRRILLLCNYQHLPYEEIARTLGITIGTVKSRISRARKNLRNLLNARCPVLADAKNAADYFLNANSAGHSDQAAA